MSSEVQEYLAQVGRLFRAAKAPGISSRREAMSVAGAAFWTAHHRHGYSVDQIARYSGISSYTVRYLLEWYPAS
jgi:hypothetical protein